MIIGIAICEAIVSTKRNLTMYLRNHPLHVGEGEEAYAGAISYNVHPVIHP
jgi:hypothetical protein